MPPLKVRVIELEGDAADIAPLLAGAFRGAAPQDREVLELAAAPSQAETPAEPAPRVKRPRKVKAARNGHTPDSPAEEQPKAGRNICPRCHQHWASKQHRTQCKAPAAEAAPAPKAKIAPRPLAPGTKRRGFCGRCGYAVTTAEHREACATVAQDAPAHPGQPHRISFEKPDGPLSRGACTRDGCEFVRWAGNSEEASARLANGDDPIAIMAEFEAAMAAGEQ